MPVHSKLALAAALLPGVHIAFADEICSGSFPQYNVMIKEDLIHGGSSDFFGPFQTCGDTTITGASFAAGSRACGFDGTTVDRTQESTSVITVGGTFTPFDANTKIYMGDITYGAISSTDFSFGQYGLPASEYGATNGDEAQLIQSDSAATQCLEDFDLIESVHSILFTKASALKASGDCNLPTTENAPGVIMFDTEGFQSGSTDGGSNPTGGSGKVQKDADTGITFWCVEKAQIETAYQLTQVPRTLEDGYEEHFNVIVLFDGDNTGNTDGSGPGEYDFGSMGQRPDFWSNGENDADNGDDNICRIYPVGTGAGVEACLEERGFDGETAEYPISATSPLWLDKTASSTVATGTLWGACFNPQKAAVSLRTAWVVDPDVLTFSKNSISWSGSLIMPQAELVSLDGNVEGNAYMKSYNTYNDAKGGEAPNEFHWFVPNPLLSNITCGDAPLSPDTGDAPTLVPVPQPTPAPDPTLCTPTPCLVDERDFPRWNALAGNNMVGYNSDVEGKAAACGDMTLDNFQIASMLGNDFVEDTTALICGQLTTRNTQVSRGETLFGGGSFNPYGSTFPDAEPAQDEGACEECAEDFEGCEDTSARMEAQATNECHEPDFTTDNTEANHHIMYFDADSKDPNYDRQGFTVFCTKCSDLKQAVKFVFDFDSDDDMIIINVENDCGSGCQEFAGKEFDTTNKAYSNKRVIWNFPDYDCLEVSSVSWTGTILAPSSELRASNANLQGNICVKSMAGTGQATAQIDYYPPVGTEDWDGYPSPGWNLDCPDNCGGDTTAAFETTVSAKTCAELKKGKQFEAERFGSSTVCGGSKFNKEGGVCAEPSTFADAKAFCEAGGARLCTLDELHNDEASGTGCAMNRKRGWSSTSCGEGKYSLAYGSTMKEGDLCADEGDLNRVRCCADA